VRSTSTGICLANRHDFSKRETIVLCTDGPGWKERPLCPSVSVSFSDRATSRESDSQKRSALVAVRPAWEKIIRENKGSLCKCLHIEQLRRRDQVEPAVLAAKYPRPRLVAHDRLVWVILRRCWTGWKRALLIVRIRVSNAPCCTASFSGGLGFNPQDGFQANGSLFRRKHL
jgi:hypothetical protein